MNEDDFWLHLEYAVDRKLSGLKHVPAGTWCDGLAAEHYDLENSRITGTAWLGKSGQEPWKFTFITKDLRLVRERGDWSDLLPDRDSTGWLSADPVEKTIEIEPARGIVSPMSSDFFKQCTIAQFDASLSMLHECLVACPDEHWDGIIGKYPFWQVAYHTLCFVDVYAARTDEAWRPQTGPAGIHPNGRQELDDEYPSRRFSRPELIGYLKQGRALIHEAMAAETSESLAGPSGFPRLRFTRFELYLYNLRHVQHHTGQLSAFLRRVNVDTRWTGTGWREL